MTMTTVVKNLLEKRFTTKVWDDKPVTNEKLNYIIDCAYLAPSKMAHHSHKIIALTDSEHGKKIKDWLFWEHTWALDGYPAYAVPKDHQSNLEKDYNGQYRAPLVLFWLSELGPPKRVKMDLSALNIKEEIYVETPDSNQLRSDIYISATAAMIAAQEQNLNTGFGVCHDTKMVAEHLGFENHSAIVALGIGYAADTKMSVRHDNKFIIDVKDSHGKKAGFCLGNVGQDEPLHWNRNSKPKIEDMVKIV